MNKRASKAGTENHILAGSMNEAFGRALGQALNVTIPMVGGSFAVGSKYNAETNEAIRLVSLEAARNSARDMLAAQISTLQLSPELKGDLDKRLSQLDTAATISGVRAIAASLRNEIREASERTTSERTLNDQEAREQRVQQLWNDIRNDIDPYLTEAERKRRQELERAVAEADTPEKKDAAERALLGFNRNKAEAMSHSDNAEERAAGVRASEKIEELKRNFAKNVAFGVAKDEVQQAVPHDKKSESPASLQSALTNLDEDIMGLSKNAKLTSLPKLDDDVSQVALGELNSMPKTLGKSTDTGRSVG